MGFWKKLGKIGLKIAPYAAMAIPGIGPAASMAIQAGLGAANAKASGGGWKDALIGAGTGAAMSRIPGLGKGISPSGAAVARQGVSDVARQVGGGGIGSILGNIGKEVGKGVLRNPAAALDIAGTAMRREPGSDVAADRSPIGGGYAESRGQVRGGFGPRDQSNPNLADYISSGRRDAIRNQPFRKGYDVISYGPEPADDAEGNIGPEIRTPMPPIYPNGGGRRKRAAM